MKKVKMIIEVVKFIGLLAHLLEAFEFIEIGRASCRERV